MRCAGARFPVAAVAIVVLVGCQSLTEDEAPTAPSEVSAFSPISIPVIGLSSTSPAPAPAPTPTPAPNPTPEPESAPPSSTVGSCSLPPSNPTNPVCTDDGPYLLAEVEAALDAVTERYPELFDFNDTRCGNCYLVKDAHRYIDEVGKQLARQGLCMVGEPEEIGVKRTNDSNEQYDILLASLHMRRGDGSYRGICRPSLF